MPEDYEFEPMYPSEEAEIAAYFHNPSDYWRNEKRLEWILKYTNSRGYKCIVWKVLFAALLLDDGGYMITPQSLMMAFNQTHDLTNKISATTARRYLNLLAQDGSMTRCPIPKSTGFEYELLLFKSVTN